MVNDSGLEEVVAREKNATWELKADPEQLENTKKILREMKICQGVYTFDFGKTWYSWNGEEWLQLNEDGNFGRLAHE